MIFTTINKFIQPHHMSDLDWRDNQQANGRGGTWGGTVSVFALPRTRDVSARDTAGRRRESSACSSTHILK